MKPPNFIVRQTRVIWTDGEKAKIVERAVDIQREHPDLSGLPLLRAAQSTLPKPRRRRFNAVTQAPWFEPGVAAEIKRRTNEERAAGDLVPITKENREALKSVVADQNKFISIHEGWRSDMAEQWRRVCQFQESALAILTLIHQEIQILNAKLGRQAAESPRPSRTARANSPQ